jgi:hypothetical protein
VLNLRHLSRRSLFLILASVLAFSALLAMGVTALIAQGGDPTSAPIGTAYPPKHTPEPPPPTMTVEEELIWRQQLRQKDREEGRLERMVGIETKGKLLIIAGKSLQLPEDAYVKVKAHFISCAVGTVCPPVPVHVIARGNSTIAIDGQGNLIEEHLAPNEENAFDFVKQVFGK